ncbi:MAG: DUF1573 domain-containing protein [Verrucomicrobiales bacterium]|nr:DUF1573 domain-containing protein [Verrucomicrobiales bacterium]
MTPAVDLGRIAPQQRLPLVLVFTNAGPAWVEVTNVARSCSCVSVQQWSRRVGPGSTGRVEVLFYAPEQLGPVTEQVVLQGQPGGDDLARLEMIGQIWQPIEATPGFVSFTSPTNTPASVRIVSHLDEPVEISDPVSTQPLFRATLNPVTVGREYQLSIAPVPPFPNANTFARIRLKTNSKIMPELSISVFMPASSPSKVSMTPRPKPAPGALPTTQADPSPRDRGHP